MTNGHNVNFYEVLGISFEESLPALSKQQIKIAYHKALLKYHPDKARAIASEPLTKPSISVNDVSRTQRFTIDQISNAYNTLSNPVQKAEYDRSLCLQRLRSDDKSKNADAFHTGLEVVDLEDLNFEKGCDSNENKQDTPEELSACWYRGCRCGDEKGFIVTEEELEKEAQHGEIVIGCRGCSLWMKILFAVAASAEDDNDTGSVEHHDAKT